MRRVGLLLVVVIEFLAVTPVKAAQLPAPADERHANNAFYAEALGPGVLYSLNYDRIFGPLAARVGAGLVLGKEESTTGRGGTVPAPLLLTFPFTVSYVGDQPQWDMFEAGAGAVLVHTAARVSTLYVKERPSATTTVVGTAIIGYRYEPPDGGLLVRLGISALVGRYGFFPVWPYASVGLAF